jgi:histidinol dehydrogenase
MRRVAPDAIALERPEAVDAGVREIVERVRSEGDPAIAAVARELGDPPPRRIASAEIERAYREVSSELRAALEGAAARIDAFASMQRSALQDRSMRIAGLEVGQRIVPIERVGVYVPGGAHPLPSSLLMCTIPAQVAGAASIAVCTPRAAPETLAAARVAGVDEIYEIGGAQAIAAMAYGTKRIARVDLVAGPGNAYVTAAKRLVLGACGIDALAGPSEVLVIASGDADARLVALDLLAQAEHDPLASAILLTDAPRLADAVDAQIECELASLETAGVARASLERNGRCAVLALEEAARLCNRLAPEHVALHGARAQALADSLHAYGALFIGEETAEVFGDYGSGPNHVLPTSGSARFSSGLSVYTFLTVRTYQRALGAAPRGIAEHAAILAQSEGLAAHRRAAQARIPA